MASPGGHKAPDLTRSLREEPQSFELDQLFRLWHLTGLGDPALPAMTGLGFAHGDVVAAAGDGDHQQGPAMAAFALTGPAGVMPHHLTARLALEAREGDSALAEFLDILSARFPALAHAAWLRGDPAALRERDAGQARAPLLALAGLGTEGFGPLVAEGAAGVGADSLAFFSALLGATPRSADGLARLLSGVLCLPVSVEQFQGGWVTLPPHSLARLGHPLPLRDGPACGERRWEVQSRLSIIIGPVPAHWTSRQIPPGQEDAPLEALRRLTRLYLGSGFEIDLRIRVSTADIPEEAARTRLGLDSWLGRPPGVEHVEDCRFRWTI